MNTPHYEATFTLKLSMCNTLLHNPICTTCTVHVLGIWLSTLQYMYTNLMPRYTCSEVHA